MSDDTSSLAWIEIANAHPVDFFTTVAGQELAFGKHRGVKRPPSWSLPSELGPWPDSIEEVAERILCLLPGTSAAIVGDFIAGPWRKRSTRYRLIGEKVLNTLESQGRVISQPEAFWIGWRATSSFLSPLKASAAQSVPVRAFLDRARLARLDETSFRRINERHDRDVAHLAHLRSLPISQRNEAWQKEVSLFEEMIAAWNQAG